MHACTHDAINSKHVCVPFFLFVSKRIPPAVEQPLLQLQEQQPPQLQDPDEDVAMAE